jgi:hypothetical protein
MPRLALLAITGGVVVPEPPEVEPPPVPVEPPEVPVLPDPLVLPELLDPLALPDPDALEPLVMPVPDVVDRPALSPLLPPHALIANAMQATSNPLRTNDVFIM